MQPRLYIIQLASWHKHVYCCLQTSYQVTATVRYWKVVATSKQRNNGFTVVFRFSSVEFIKDNYTVSCDIFTYCCFLYADIYRPLGYERVYLPRSGRYTLSYPRSASWCYKTDLIYLNIQFVCWLLLEVGICLLLLCPSWCTTTHFCDRAAAVGDTTSVIGLFVKPSICYITGIQWLCCK